MYHQEDEQLFTVRRSNPSAPPVAVARRSDPFTRLSIRPPPFLISRKWKKSTVAPQVSRSTLGYPISEYRKTRPASLSPLDVAVAIRLAQVPAAGYARLSNDLGIALSQAHASVRRLSKARLVSAKKREVNRRGLLEFLQHGVKYAFPAELGRKAIGVPTAYAGPPLASKLVFDEPVVWPTLEGNSEGPAINPLYPQAVSLPERCPELYEALTVVDALRIGRAREQELAIHELERITRPHSLQAELSESQRVPD